MQVKTIGAYPTFKGFPTSSKLPPIRTFSANFMENIHSKRKDSESFIIWLIKKFPHRIRQEYYNYFIKNLFMLTEFDTPAIIRTRRILSTLEQKKVSEEIKALIASRKLESSQKYPKQKDLTVITGLPGCGKSTYINQHGLTNSHYLLDVDDIREDIIKEHGRQYGDISLAKIKHQLFHGEAIKIFKQNLISNLAQNGTNIVLPTSGTFNSIEIIANFAKSRNYKVNIVHIDVPLDVSIARGFGRVNKENRFYDPLFATRRAAEIYHIPRMARNSSLIDSLKTVKQT